MPVTIYSDSEYSIKSLTEWRDKWVRNGFRNVQGLPVAYSKLVREGHYLVDSFTDLALVHVRGHTGLEGNEAADKLAKTARYLAEGRSSDKYPAQLEGLVMVDGIDPDTGDVHKR